MKFRFYYSRFDSAAVFVNYRINMYSQVGGTYIQTNKKQTKDIKHVTRVKCSIIESSKTQETDREKLCIESGMSAVQHQTVRSLVQQDNP